MKPWSQFYNLCDMFANTDGSFFQAAQLSDARFEVEIERIIFEKKNVSSRPPLAGDTAVIKGIRDLRNDIRLLMRIQGADVPFVEGPEGPGDRIRARKKAVARARINEILGNA